METKATEITIEKLIDWRLGKPPGKIREPLVVNYEYQRGAVWEDEDILLFIDSVLRGYKIPLIYLYKTPKQYEIIDGQQRINAFLRFTDWLVPGARKTKPLPALYNPSAKKNLFLIQKEADCEWAGKTFKDLTLQVQKQFLDTKVPVVVIDKTNDDEMRDLFLRLQRGKVLQGQEKRDAWPGEIGPEITKLGGKEESGNPGHPFFKLTRIRKSYKTRTLAVKSLMLFINRREHQGDFFTDIRADDLDGFYLEHMTIENKVPDYIERFKDILNKLHNLLDIKGQRIKEHEVIHLVLFVDMLYDDYTDEWESSICQSLEQFRKELTEAKDNADMARANPDDRGNIRLGAHHYDFMDYETWTNTQGDTSKSIKIRHAIYTQQMLRILGDRAKMKDDKKHLLEEVYQRDNQLCQVCVMNDVDDGQHVKREDAAIHYVRHRSEGGTPELDNGVLVHRHHRPAIAVEVNEFRRWHDDQAQKRF